MGHEAKGAAHLAGESVSTLIYLLGRPTRTFHSLSMAVGGEEAYLMLQVMPIQTQAIAFAYGIAQSLWEERVRLPHYGRE